MTAVIEFKGKNNTEHYDEVVASVKKSGATVAYISFHEECLKAMRKLTDADMFFLSQIIDDDAISVAKSMISTATKRKILIMTVRRLKMPPRQA